MIAGDWVNTTVGDLAQVKGGKRLPAGYSVQSEPTPHPYIRVTDMRDGGVDEADIKYVPVAAADSIRAYRIGSDDIFISVAGTLGIVGRIPAQLDGANLTENADRLTAIKCDVDYLAQYLRSTAIQDEIEAIRTVGAQPKLALGRIKSFAVQMPADQAEQELIAGALNDADALIQGLERVIDKKRDVKQGLMQELLAGRTRLPGFTGDWEQEKLGAVATMGSGGTPPSTVTRYYGGEIPWVSISDMTRGGKYIAVTEKTLTEAGLTSSAAKLYEPDVVLYAMYASLGECSLAVGRVASSQAILGIKVSSRLDREFLYYVLQNLKSRVKLLGQQGTQSNLNAGMVRNFDLELPPIEEQLAIASVLKDADDEIQALERRLESARAVKVGMMQELLTGRTRLPVKEEV